MKDVDWWSGLTDRERQSLIRHALRADPTVVDRIRRDVNSVPVDDKAKAKAGLGRQKREGQGC